MRGNSVSAVDMIYRAIIGKGLFPAGWGDVGRLRTLMQFHEIMCKRDKVQSLIDPQPKVLIEKVERSNNFSVHHGQLFSPFAKHCPGLLPECAEVCRFQFVVPKEFRLDSKPVAIHMAGTGDQQFWRRRVFLAETLATTDGIASLIMENPFYGSRRPKDQTRSNVRFVSDIFSMGGGLMLESLAILRWLELEGFGPFCMTGISMGGHMASLGATNYPKPIAIAPCLSWTTASTVFTRGVMSNAINWATCDHAYINEPAFRQEFYDNLIYYDLETKDREARAKTDDSSDVRKKSGSKVLSGSRSLEKWLRVILELPKTLSGPLKWGLPPVSFFNPSDRGSNEHQRKAEVERPTPPKLNFYKRGDSAARRESLEFMKRLMDHFTHLSNFEKPVDPELATVISARYDGYVLKDGVKSIQDIWPGCTVRYLDSGHVIAYLMHQKEFRTAIRDSLLKHREKYHRDGTPRQRLEAGPPPSGGN